MMQQLAEAQKVDIVLGALAEEAKYQDRVPGDTEDTFWNYFCIQALSKETEPQPQF